jgi:small subunit ribosomal protein S4e
MHLKRNKAPNKWPVERKGSKYIVRPNHDLNNGIPLLIILRDILKLAENKKEVQKLINLNKIKVNNKLVRSVKHPLTLFDVLSLDKKNFVLGLEGRKYVIEEGGGKEKISKVIGKNILKKGKMQVNLSDGRNYLIDKKINTGDSVVIDLEKNNISDILQFKEGCKVLFISGRHIGEKGKVSKSGKDIVVDIDGGKVNTQIDSLMVIK